MCPWGSGEPHCHVTCMWPFPTSQALTIQAFPAGHGELPRHLCSRMFLPITHRSTASPPPFADPPVSLLLKAKVGREVCCGGSSASFDTRSGPVLGSGEARCESLPHQAMTSHRWLWICNQRRVRKLSRLLPAQLWSQNALKSTQTRGLRWGQGKQGCCYQEKGPEHCTESLEAGLHWQANTSAPEALYQNQEPGLHMGLLGRNNGFQASLASQEASCVCVQGQLWNVVR